MASSKLRYRELVCIFLESMFKDNAVSPSSWGEHRSNSPYARMEDYPEKYRNEGTCEFSFSLLLLVSGFSYFTHRNTIALYPALLSVLSINSSRIISTISNKILVTLEVPVVMGGRRDQDKKCLTMASRWKEEWESLSLGKWREQRAGMALA